MITAQQKSHVTIARTANTMTAHTILNINPFTEQQIRLDIWRNDFHLLLGLLLSRYLPDNLRLTRQTTTGE